MTTRRRRGSLFFPLMLVFLGIMFLLINLGVLDSSVWSNLWRYWPVLLIVLGIDALFQRPSPGSAIASAIGTVVTIAVVFVLISWFAPEAWVRDAQPLSQSLGGATAADIRLECTDCAIRIAPGDPSLPSARLLEGEIDIRRDEKLTRSTRRDGEVLHFTLRSTPRLPIPLSARHALASWDIAFQPEVPISLSVETGGACTLDLRDLSLSSADLQTGDSLSIVWLPREQDTTVTVSGARITITVPNDSGIRIYGIPHAELTTPANYTYEEDSASSENYDEALYRIDIILRPGAGRVEILQAP